MEFTKSPISKRTVSEDRNAKSFFEQNIIEIVAEKSEKNKKLPDKLELVSP